jgi:hypothetical protein
MRSHLHQPTVSRPASVLLRDEFEDEILHSCTLEAPNLLPLGGACYVPYTTIPGGFISHVLFRPGAYS